jgi:predicted nuclease of predicted toxin-antitoxin system
MTLLVDENLPASIARDCCESEHALSLGHRPTDTELWKTAKAKGRVILTKDADFFNRLMAEGPPPKVIWLRVGNMRRHKLESFFRTCWPSIAKLLEDYDLIEVFSHQIEALSFSGQSC